MPNFDRRFDDFRSPEKIEQGGLINLSGNFLLDHEEEVLNLIKHQGRLAEEKNPLHRLVSINKSEGNIAVTTSDHNLALKIGKSLVNAFKGEHQYKFLDGERFVEVNWKRD